MSRDRRTAARVSTGASRTVGEVKQSFPIVRTNTHFNASKGVGVWKWLKSRTNPQTKPAGAELKGAPARLRTKTYSAETGYVYQYVYQGYRQISDPLAGTDYVFSVSRDRKVVLAVTIRLLDAALAECAAISGREILKAEQYALAKMTIFDGFDRIADAAAWQTPLTPDGAEMVNYLRTLGRI